MTFLEAIAACAADPELCCRPESWKDDDVVGAFVVQLTSTRKVAVKPKKPAKEDE